MATYIRAASLGRFEELVRGYGINPIEILKEIGILPSLLRDPDAFIQYEYYLNLLEKSAFYCQDACFGLKLGALQNMHTIGLMGIYMSRQSNVLEALKIAQKYVYLHAESVVFDITQIKAQQCKLNFIRLSEYSADIPQKSQLTIRLMANILQDLVGPQWHATQIKFKQKPPKTDLGVFKLHFECDVEFETNEDAIYFPAEFLSFKPYRNNENLVNQFILQQIETQGSTKTTDNISLIKSSFRMLMATGDCNINNIALCLGIHPKKLQRVLKTQGTSYRHLLEDVRKKEAMRMIDAGNISLTDIALQLGYAELSIFSRNFKSWFGYPPNVLKGK